MIFDTCVDAKTVFSLFAVNIFHLCLEEIRRSIENGANIKECVYENNFNNVTSPLGN